MRRTSCATAAGSVVLMLLVTSKSLRRSRIGCLPAEFRRFVRFFPVFNYNEPIAINYKKLIDQRFAEESCCARTTAAARFEGRGISWAEAKHGFLQRSFMGRLRSD
jgi:hypothetical protein